MAHCANMTQSFRTVALYDTLGADAVEYIVRHAELTVVVCEKDKLPALFEAIRKAGAESASAADADGDDAVDADDDSEADEKKEESSTDEELPPMQLKFILQIDFDELYGNTHENVDEGDRETAKELGVELLGISEMIERGKELGDEVPEVTKDDTAYLMYTSGTTGNPKGVMLSHQGFSAMVATAYRTIQMKNDDVHMSYLPLAHIFEAMVQQVMASAGAKIAYFQGEVRKLALDWKEIRPTVLVGVPRVFNKTYDKFQLKVKGMTAMKKWLVTSAQESSEKAIRSGKRSKFYDSMVWSAVSPEIGFDRVRVVVSGAAPLPPHIAEFLRIILPDAVVLQGYGMTENTAGCTITQVDDMNLGHVGVPIDNMELRLVDAPECGYSVKDEPYPRGEIVCRGLCVMQGYYKNPEKTAEVIDKDGWLHTGDIGRINPNGTFSIIDRRKNMFKTAMGEYIAAEKVEGVYLRAPTAAQIFLYGNSFKSFVVAVVVPDAATFEAIWKEDGTWTKEGLFPGTAAFAEYFMELAATRLDKVKEIVLADLRSQEVELKGFEKIKDIYIEHTIDELMQGFNVENGLQTPTFKLKRPQALRKYIEPIKAMYTTHGEPPMDSEHWID
jgi:long-chain acyl-CoA synthetase